MMKEYEKIISYLKCKLHHRIWAQFARLKACLAQLSILEHVEQQLASRVFVLGLGRLDFSFIRVVQLEL